MKEVFRKLTKDEWDLYVKPYAGPKLREIIKTLWFQFSSKRLNENRTDYILAQTDGVKVAFLEPKPGLMTFWHEIAHVVLHKDIFPKEGTPEFYVMELQADYFALEITGGNKW